MDHEIDLTYPKQVQNGLKNTDFEHILRGSDLGIIGTFFIGFFSYFMYHVRLLKYFHLKNVSICLPSDKIDKNPEKYKFDTTEILL